MVASVLAIVVSTYKISFIVKEQNYLTLGDFLDNLNLIFISMKHYYANIWTYDIWRLENIASFIIKLRR